MSYAKPIGIYISIIFFLLFHVIIIFALLFYVSIKYASLSCSELSSIFERSIIDMTAVAALSITFRSVPTQISIHIAAFQFFFEEDRMFKFHPH